MCVLSSELFTNYNLLLRTIKIIYKVQLILDNYCMSTKPIILKYDIQTTCSILNRRSSILNRTPLVSPIAIQLCDTNTVPSCTSHLLLLSISMRFFILENKIKIWSPNLVCEMVCFNICVIHTSYNLNHIYFTG